MTPNEEVQTFEKSDQDGRKASKGAKPKGKFFYSMVPHG